jgi:hypothetical protein
MRKSNVPVVMAFLAQIEIRARLVGLETVGHLVHVGHGVVVFELRDGRYGLSLLRRLRRRARRAIRFRGQFFRAQRFSAGRSLNV